MKSNEFLSKLDHERIVTAIGAAEHQTSGEIRVYISHRQIDDAMARAKRRFDKLEMRRTKHRNAVLIYLAPRSQLFAIIGDTGVHEKCGDVFWEKVSAGLSQDLKSGHATEAIVRAVEQVGNLLGEHFPPEAGTRTALPNEVIEE